MKNIKEHIKNNQYKSVYLLYGSEVYLKKLYKNKLIEGILDGAADEMNYSYFEGKGIDVGKVIQIADTLPFFSERRLIVIENSSLFKSQSDLADYLKGIPESTHIVFVEEEIDKRSKLFKTVKDIGYISEMNGLDEKNLKLWAASILNKDNKKVTSETLSYLFSKVGLEMENLQSELEKLVCYAYDREIITVEDIEEICTTQITSKIFQMIDAIGLKQPKTAFALYSDLLALREKPMSILYLITRHFNILLQVKDLNQLGHDKNVISQKVGVPPFAVTKYINQAKNFSGAVLKNAIEFSADLEEEVKTGRLADKIAVELLLVKYSAA